MTLTLKIVPFVAFTALLALIFYPRAAAAPKADAEPHLRAAALTREVAALQATYRALPEVKPTPLPRAYVPAGCESVVPLLAEYPWDVSIAVAVMQAESGCNPQALNPTDNHRVCTGSMGLMQIGCLHAQTYGVSVEGLYDPATNIRIAYALYLEHGWQPWSAYKNKSYQRFLR